MGSLTPMSTTATSTGDDDDHELRLVLHDESDEAYVHDTFVHSDDWTTYIIEDIDFSNRGRIVPLWN